MRAAFGLVIFGAGSFIGITFLAFAILWWRTADVVRAFHLD